MATADYEFHIDWNNDGTFTGTGEDVTDDVLRREPLSIAYGRDQARALSPMRAGEASFLLDNVSRDYSPENASSPLAGNILPARPVRIRATHLAQTYNLFRGFTDDYDVLPDVDNRSVKLTFLDAIARLRGIGISTELYTALQTGDAVGHVLDAIEWPLADRDIDPGATTMRHWWEDDTDALTALERIVASEGPPALVTVDADGNFVFRDRHHRLTRTASEASQATFSDVDVEPVFARPLVYDHGWRDIINTVDFRVDERRAAEDHEVVWSTDDVFSVDVSSSLPLHASATDPFTDAIAPVQDIDFTVQAGSITNVTLSRTSGQSVVVTLTAGAGGASVRGLALRARPAPVIRTYRITASDSASQDDFGERSMPDALKPVWAGRHDAQAIADLLMLQRADRLPIVQMRVLNATDDRLSEQLGRDLSDRITIVEPELGLDDDFFIEQIAHNAHGFFYHETIFGCEKAPSAPGAPFTLGTSELGTGELGY